MAKELPYFKFEPNQWENGNIQMLSREDKGLFIDLCSMYWSRLGDLPIKLAIMKLCNGNKNSLDELIENNIVTIKENNIKISFLEEQLSTFSLTSKNNTVNANIRWEKIPERITGNLVYVIRCWNKDEEFLKIGITKTSINRRFSGKIPYEYEAIIVDFYSDIELESQYSEIAKGCEYYAKKNFSGHLECYNISILPKLIDFANIRNAKYVRKQCENDAIREDKIKEDKINTISLSLENDFLTFWNIYNKKNDSKKCRDKFFKLPKKDIDKILEVVKDYVNSTPEIQYRKNPLTWLNGKCWEDSIINKKPQSNEELNNLTTEIRNSNPRI